MSAQDNTIRLTVSGEGATKEEATANALRSAIEHAFGTFVSAEISKERNPQGLTENARVAKEGADVAKAAREDVEKRLGRSVVSSEKAIDYIQSPEELPFEKPDDQ